MTLNFEYRLPGDIDKCPICGVKSTSTTAFCSDHELGWATSPERREVDWQSYCSYETQILEYAIRFRVTPPEVPGGGRDREPDDD